ncbi:MAG: hypothetical protein LAT51_11545 [Flavobacteriaceae bacterium]|nr:hypothetical protein [Flavobacteriaceae bacterium]
MNVQMKSNNRYLFILFSILIISFTGCKNETKEEEKEKEFTHDQIVKRKSKEQRYALHVSEIHKSAHYKSEAYVGFELDIQLPGLEDHLKIIKATDFSEIQFTSKKYGDFYVVGDQVFSASTSTINPHQAQSYLDLAFAFGAFSQIFEEANIFGEIEEKQAFENKYKLMQIEKLNSNFAFAPSALTSWTDARTDMLKAISMQFHLTQDQKLLYFDRYITVNRVPVSLTWKLFDEGAESDLIKQASGEIKVSRIKYYSKGEYQIKVPEETKNLNFENSVQ